MEGSEKLLRKCNKAARFESTECPIGFSGIPYVIDKLPVAGVLKKTSGHEEFIKLILLLFVSHKDSPFLVTLKSGKVWLLGEVEKI